MKVNQMQAVQALFFLLGYLAIIFEHSIRVHKTVSAIIMAVILWGLEFYRIGMSDSFYHYLSDASQIYFFILGSLAIVEQMHDYGSLNLIGSAINRLSRIGFLWVLLFISFFMSTVLDNLTTTIVMVTIVQRTFSCTEEDRKLLGALVVIAANAGGTWSPIGDVTTTMLWMGEKLSTGYIISSLFIPSCSCALIASYVLARKIQKPLSLKENGKSVLDNRGKYILLLGSILLLLIPAAKQYWNIPPFMGVLFALAVMWLITDFLQKEKDQNLTIPSILKKIDLPGTLFFFAILLAVNALDSSGVLRNATYFMNSILARDTFISFFIGLFSALVDNIPLVAATMRMYGENGYPIDAPFWSLIAYCSGVGGSIFVIGSAAGLAFMGLEPKVNFGWYMRKISFAAFLGYVGGFIIWIVQHNLIAKI